MGHNFSPKQLLRMYAAKPAEYWAAAGQKRDAEIFKFASQKVPAYKKFLSENGVRSLKIKTAADIAALPAMAKDNYFRKYPLAEQTAAGQYQTQAFVMTSTTGSTGQPVYFPRPDYIDWQYSVLADFFLNNGPKGPTLLINCFGMGVWVGGIITHEAFYLAGQRGQAISIISPGVNKKEIYHALEHIAPLFKNVILAGYPPLLKDIADDAADMKLNSKKIHFRLLFAAEGFNETFRDHLCRQLHIKNPYLDSLAIYGSAELGAMAHESPGSILMRRLALKHKNIYRALFGENPLPTLAHFNPLFVNFAAPAGEILITADSATPFINFKIGDRGGVFTMDEIKNIFRREKINLEAEAKKLGIVLLNLPLVYLYERSDFATKLSGAIIYPGPVREALQTAPCNRFCTGKFLMQTLLDKNHNQFLEINVELRPKAMDAKQNAALCQKRIVEHLLKKNAEYKYLYGTIAKKITPVIKLFPYEHKTYFKPGVKQRWVN